MNIIISKQLTKTECIHAPTTPISEYSNLASVLLVGTSPFTFEKINYIDITINQQLQVLGIKL